MEVIFKIIITKEYKLICSIVDKENKIIIIQEEVIPCIKFNYNTIDFCENCEDENTIYFFKNWFEKPDDYSTYSIEYQNKTFDLLPEVLFSLIVNEFKKKIEKDYIIENTFIELPIDNSKLLQRIKIALQGIHIKGVDIAEDEQILYDCRIQGEYLQELLESKETIEK